MAMRIAYVCADPGVPVFGCKGCSIHVQEILRAFVRLGHEVTLFGRRLDGVAPSDLASVSWVRLPSAAGEGADREIALAETERCLGDLLDREGPFDLVYERYALWSRSALWWAREAGVPSVLEVNAPLIDEQIRYRELHHRQLAEALSGDALTAARRLVAVSSGVANWLRSEGVDPARVEVIANGVDSKRFEPDFSTRSDIPVIGFVGTLKPWHGLDVLVAAADRLRQQGLKFRLLIVGDGSARSALEAELENRGLRECSELTGAVDPREIPGLLARMDIAVAPYPDARGFYFSPLKVMEYMAAGRAIVASRIGDVDGLVRHDVNGLLCPPGDVIALAKTLAELIHDPAARTRLGRAARAHAVDNLGWHSVARRVLDVAMETPPC